MRATNIQSYRSNLQMLPDMNYFPPVWHDPQPIMLEIHLPISTTNVLLFFLIDAPAVWAIQRGIVVLQAYYLYRQAHAGRTVRLARSRIPVVGGELLRGVTR